MWKVVNVYRDRPVLHKSWYASDDDFERIIRDPLDRRTILDLPTLFVRWWDTKTGQYQVFYRE